MKKIIIVLVLSTSIAGLNFAQENQQNDGINLYTFFLNIINEQFRFPLIGFVNIAGGSHSLPQIGFVNWNQNNFRTLQMGFINTVGGDTEGLQLGFVNTTIKSFTGVQMGFVNTVGGDTEGLQLGFVNTTVKSFTGAQIGFVNTAVGENVGGLQLGFVNTTINKFSGAQISFVNITKHLNGLQLGFINYTDSIEKGIPIGFLSIVRNGGYKAIELGISEISPFNVSFKIGVERFYTTFIVSYNPFRESIRDQIIWGAGFGTIIPLGATFFINPELTAHNGINENFQHTSFVPYFGYNILPNLSVVAGPSVIWAYAKENKDMENPFYHIFEYTINDDNKLYLGTRIAIRFRW
jgi:hypothetical protein